MNNKLRIRTELVEIPIQYNFPFFKMDKRIIYRLQKKGIFGIWHTINKDFNKEKIENQFKTLKYERK